MHTKTLFAFAIGCAVAFSSCGCGEKTTATQPAAGDRDRLLRTQLVGRWQRAWDLGPVVYERVLSADGALVMREKRQTASAPAAPPEQPGAGPAAAAEKEEHPKYPGAFAVAQELSGTWSVQDGQVAYQVLLPNGDPLTMRYAIERLTATELVESSSGLSGKTEFRFRRRS